MLELAAAAASLSSWPPLHPPPLAPPPSPGTPQAPAPAPPWVVPITMKPVARAGQGWLAGILRDRLKRTSGSYPVLRLRLQQALHDLQPSLLAPMAYRQAPRPAPCPGRGLW